MRLVLSWLGGKTKALPLLRQLYPKQLHSYVESYVGGGSVLFDVLEHVDQGKIELSPAGAFHVNDLNSSLISFYRVLQSDQYTKMIQDLESLRQELLHLSLEQQRQMFSQIRDEFNSFKKQKPDSNTWTEKERWRQVLFFLFLNKAAYRGMYRENRQGDYNVSFASGGAKRGWVIVSDWERTHRLLNAAPVRFYSMEATQFMRQLRVPKRSLFFLDPPYVAIDETKEKEVRFYQYMGAAHKQEHKEGYDPDLFGWIAANSNRHDIIMTNRAVAEVKRHIMGWPIVWEYDSARSVGAKASGSGSAKELIACNRA